MKGDLLCSGLPLRLERKPNGIAFKKRLLNGHLKRSARFKKNLFDIKLDCFNQRVDFFGFLAGFL